MEIAVVGCGVMGLSCGIRLLEAGHNVQIYARDLPPNTTSNWAAAIWHPYHTMPSARVLKWGADTFNEFQRLLAEPAAGVSFTTLLEPFDAPAPDPWWRDAVRSFRRATPEELPAGYADGYIVEVPVIDTHIYVDYLVNRFREGGGRIQQRELHSLDELATDYPVIVNCTGLGARTLLGDEAVYPIRGQIMKVSAPHLKRSFVDEVAHLTLTYIIPRTHDVVLGGTALANDWTEEVDPAIAADILARCTQIEPTLADAPILQHGVGLRPGRPQVRLEAEPWSENCTVVHNYGHGGAGFTLSWGCADEVAALVGACDKSN